MGKLPQITARELPDRGLLNKILKKDINLTREDFEGLI